jgi:hypothetical protein
MASGTSPGSWKGFARVDWGRSFLGLSGTACGRSDRKRTTLTTFGGDEDDGVGGPNGFTAERAGGTLDELYALAETNGREPCAASSEWPASQRKCSIRAILPPSTNAVPQAAPSSAQNRQAKERGEKGHSCEPI